MRKDEGLWLRVGATVEVWGLEQHLGGAGGWDVAEGPGLSQRDGERAQVRTERTGVDSNWGLKLGVRSKVL